jgi:capsular exopolysaccharide synthesis family protein
MSEVYEALRRSGGLTIAGDEPEESDQGASSSWTLLQSESGGEGLCLNQAALVQPRFTSESRLVALAEGNNLGKEKFMVLSSHLKHLQDRHQLKRVALTSSLQREGKSLVATNLAISLARSTKQKVLLLEGDLRQPVVSQLLGCGDHAGLSEWLQGPAQSNFLFRLEGLSLWLLFAGIRRERPLELLQSTRLPQLLGLLGQWFDWIVIDAPPLLPLADASIWVRLADGALMVVRENQTPKKILRHAMEMVGQSSLIGLVLNDVRNLDERYYKTENADRPN